MMSTGGQVHYIAASALQLFSWRLLIEGFDAALRSAPPHLSGRWADQVRSGLIPAPPAEGLQGLYRRGLSALDSYSRSTFGTSFATALAPEQDLMLEAAGDLVLSQFPAPSPPAAPDDAKALFPYLVTHTFEGTYGLPEYRGMRHNPVWEAIGWDGDTQPLGNSIYDDNLHGPGEGPNAGFGEEGVFVPRGGYRQHRPVSAVGPLSLHGRELGPKDVRPLIELWRRNGALLEEHGR
jgi:hypothetical protein